MCDYMIENNINVTYGEELKKNVELYPTRFLIKY